MIVSELHNGHLLYWRVEISSDSWRTSYDDIIIWCTEQFGPMIHRMPERNERRWTNFRNVFLFSNKDDLIWFLLRWKE